VFVEVPVVRSWADVTVVRCLLAEIASFDPFHRFTELGSEVDPLRLFLSVDSQGILRLRAHTHRFFHTIRKVGVLEISLLNVTALAKAP